MKSFHQFLVFFLVILHGASGLNILVIHAFYSGSPVLTWRAAGEYFAKQGHHVHYLRWKDTHFHPQLPHPNMTETVRSINNENGTLAFLTQESEAGFDIPFDLLLSEGMSYLTMYYEVMKAYPLFTAICDDLLGDKIFIKELTRMNFHIAIVDLPGSECSLALTNYLGIPTVGFWGMQFASGEATMTTASLPPSFTPNLLSSLSSEMTFLERVMNTGIYLVSQGVVRGQCLLLQSTIRKHLPNSPDPCFLLKDLNGLLINSDHIMDTPQLLPPTFVRVGGMHIKEERKPLPKEIDEWVQSSGDDGVIIFAAGYTLNPNVLPRRFIQEFLKAAGRMPQKFLMKLEEGSFGQVPKNVKIMSWLPQQDLLANNHTRLFVTHCGLQSVLESIHFGVPMVGMPIFFDQGDYLVKLLKHGVALPLNKEKATADDIHKTLTTVLETPSFKGNAKRLSNLMRDAKETPQQRALDLLKYLVRHKGAPHLKMNSRHLNFIEYFCIDVAIFLLTIVYLMYRISLKIGKIVVKCVSSFNWTKPLQYLRSGDSSHKKDL